MADDIVVVLEAPPPDIMVELAEVGLVGPPGGVESVNAQTGDVVLDAADVGADPTGSAATAQAAAATALAAHVAAGDPHPQYLTLGEGNAAYDAAGAASAAGTAAASALASHEADTTLVHGIANTALLETIAGAQAKVDAAVSALMGGSPSAALDTLLELGEALQVENDAVAALTVVVAGKAADADLDAHTANTSNPHSVTKTQVGLGNVDNTADTAKPVSTAQATADAAVGTAAGNALAAHEADTTAVHGIANMALLETATGAQAKADAALSAAIAANPYSFPKGYLSGFYYFCNSPAANGVSTLGTGTMRLSPWVVTAPVTITKMFAEFSIAGDAASVLKLAVYASDANGRPNGAPVIDPGSISTGSGNAGTVATGGTPGVYEITLGTPVTLQPGIYWVAGVPQGITVTNPTVRICSTGQLLMPTAYGTSLPGVAAVTGVFVQAGVTGALPTLTGSSMNAQSAAAARLGFKTS